MKKYFLMAAIFWGLAVYAQAKPIHPTDFKTFTVADSLNVYTGKYKMKREDGNEFYLTLSVENGQLVALELWDNQKKYLNHVSGDDFIVDGLGWAVSFERDKDKKIIALLVRGTDTWTKVVE
jgi:hypothetical protein